MIQLSREIRFAMLPPDIAYSPTVSNSWNGWPATDLGAPQMKLRLVVQGNPDPVTGYVCNITVLDRLLRSIVTSTLIPQHGGQFQSGAAIVRSAFESILHQWSLPDDLVRVELSLSEFQKFTIQTESADMVQLSQQFEFSAAHRLHCDSLTDQENRDTFGKCNNLRGHGHNYVVDVSVAGKTDDAGTVIDLESFYKIVNTEVIDRLDHKHLNQDVPYFADVNPSVENIAIAIYRWLSPKLDGTLQAVKVFETPKTWAEYRGEA